MAKPTNWKLQRESRSVEDWLFHSEQGKMLKDEPRVELESLLQRNDSVALRFIKTELRYIELWQNQFGAFTVLQRDSTGWQHLLLATHISGWSLRLEYGLYMRPVDQVQPQLSPLEHTLAARCLVLAIALRLDEFADWAGKKMLDGAAGNDAFFASWKLTPFLAFVARLYALWRGLKVNARSEPLRNLGIYKKLIDGFGDEKQYGRALVAACDYHCERTRATNAEFREFWESPFPVFPAEILATQRVRQELLGSAPEIEHPLLDSPLGRVPPSIQLPKDPLIERAIDKIKTELGDLIN